MYAWETGWVLKLFRAGYAQESVEAEAHSARVVHKAMAEIGTLSVPVVGEIVEVGGRYGLLYQQIEGISLLEKFMDDSAVSFIDCAHHLAELHARIHSLTAVSVPSLHQLPAQRNRLFRVSRRQKHCQSHRVLL